MLSFELENEGKAIQIHCDSAGMGTLLRALSTLIQERGGHVHLCGPSAGGNDLNEVSPFGTKAFQEVIVNYAEGDPRKDT